MCLTKLQKKKEPFINVAIHSIVAINFVIRIRTYSYYYVLCYIYCYTRDLSAVSRSFFKENSSKILGFDSIIYMNMHKYILDKRNIRKKGKTLHG